MTWASRPLGLELLQSMRAASVAYRALLASLLSAASCLTRADHRDGVDAHGGGFPPVTCVIADGGSSATEFRRLVGFIRELSTPSAASGLS